MQAQLHLAQFQICCNSILPTASKCNRHCGLVQTECASLSFLNRPGTMNSFASRLGRFEITVSAKKKTIANAMQKSQPQRSNLENPALTVDQSESPFLQKLPYDVRLLIYQHLLQGLGNVWYIETRPGNGMAPGSRLCQPCVQNPEEDSYTSFYHCQNSFWSKKHIACRRVTSTHLKAVAQLTTFRDLLLTCRLVYVQRFLLEIHNR